MFSVEESSDTARPSSTRARSASVCFEQDAEDERAFFEARLDGPGPLPGGGAIGSIRVRR
jgi:hypothetical protein